MENFRKLGINSHILKVIEEERFEKPSEIQEKTIPLSLEGKDIIAGSATGSGKTLAFGVNIIQNTARDKGIQSLVLTPTRELAEQICKSLRKFAKHDPLDIVAIYGGVGIEPQIEKLRHADVVVGTPGRILDHLERRTLYLGNVKILVLDEADRMFDMGFIEDVERIIKNCPEKRQTSLFSATIDQAVTKLSHKYMHNPVKINAIQYVDPSKLRQVYYDVQDNLKFSLLVHFLHHERSGLVMVFCNTQRTTDWITKNLRKCDVDAVAIHGGLSQAKRGRALETFHSKKGHVLVCTDVAARGLDIPGVSHVYNYDTPNDPNQYVHRIGRTARAGNEGIAITLLSSRDHDNFRAVQRDRSLNIVKLETPRVEKVEISHDRDREMHERADPRRRSGPKKFYENARRFRR